MMENHIEIPAAWCIDKNILSGYLTLEAAKSIAESDIPDSDFVIVKAFYGREISAGETWTPAAAVRAKFKEKLIKRYESI